MTSTSQRTPARHADASQSGRPRSTSSTNWNSSDGRLRRNISFSSGELTVIVHTVFLSACASWKHSEASNAAATTTFGETGMDQGAEKNRAREYRMRTVVTAGQA